MWTEITAEQNELLTRYFEIMRMMDHRNRGQSISTGVAQLRSSVARKRVQLFYFQDVGFDMVMRFQWREPRKRFFVCFGFLGAVTPEDVLDILYDKSLAFSVEHGQTELFATQGKTVDYPPMQQVFDLVFTDPRVQIAIITDLADCRVLQIAKRPSP